MNEQSTAYFLSRPKRDTAGVTPGTASAYANGYLKRAMDVLIATVSLVLFTPLMAYAALRVRLSSHGPVIYRQERIGRGGKPFTILKFRSMWADAEREGPQLSSPTDPRITPWGRTMRKFRIDELPQLWNVLRGDMSLVGPRPERAFFIGQILPQHPAYSHLLDVRPGLTGRGMVRFGYAENIRQMSERMHHDIHYVRNASFWQDILIMWQTFRIILLGTGK
ncbi:MAG: sugar transferase [Chitinophagaceae bacterium]|jgi:lipopolysaccharide/colanic/teichoic acid biosynthesis glycosyltransferase|nr:sugar transferase [Chitinophagaceae bacterium]